MSHDFIIYFNDNKQWLEVHKDGAKGNWGYFISTWKYPHKGLFGKVYLSNIAEADTVVHEAFHVVIAHALANKISIRGSGEEYYALMIDEIYKKIKNKIEGKDEQKTK